MCSPHSRAARRRFADPFLQRSGLDGSFECSKSLSTLSLALSRLYATLSDAAGGAAGGAAGAARAAGAGGAGDDAHALQPAQLGALQGVVAALEASKKLWKSYEEFATLCVEEGVCAPRTPGRALLASCPA